MNAQQTIVLSLCTALAVHQPVGQLRGRALGTLGDPIDGVQVQIVGTLLSGTSGADGVFVIRGIPEGSYSVEIRRIGYKAQRFAAAFAAGETKEVKVVMEQGAYELPDLTVTVNRLKPIEYAWTTRYDDFFRRKQVGLGAYITRDQIDRRGGGRTPSLLAGIRGVRLRYRHPGQSGTDVEIIGCNKVSVWIDGQKQRYADVPTPRPVSLNVGLRHPAKVDESGAITASNLERVLPSEIEMIEVYRGPGEMPAEFLDDSCAAIAIWTR